MRDIKGLLGEWKEEHEKTRGRISLKEAQELVEVSRVSPEGEVDLYRLIYNAYGTGFTLGFRSGERKASRKAKGDTI